MTPGTNRDRLEQIAHYVIARTPSDQLGATKLNKVLWYIDCMTWWARGESLSGLKSYTRMKLGPVPKPLQKSLAALKRDNRIIERQVDTPAGVRREFISMVEPDFGGLSAEDVDRINRVITHVCRLSAREASDATHDALWAEIPEGGEMSIAAGSVASVDPDDDDLDWARAEAQQLGLNA